jgi:hypothetical protein
MRLSSSRYSCRHGICILPRVRQRLFQVDNGYVVVCGLSAGVAAAEGLSAERRHVTLVLPAPDGLSDVALDAFALEAAAGCARIVIYEGKMFGRGKQAECGARVARAVRSSARTECRVLLDDTRALRHCIDGMAAGDIIVYCCDDPANAIDILDEYGAKAVADVESRRRREPVAAGSGPSGLVKPPSIPLPPRFGRGRNG